jgi:hypothetical protein
MVCPGNHVLDMTSMSKSRPIICPHSNNMPSQHQRHKNLTPIIINAPAPSNMIEGALPLYAKSNTDAYSTTNATYGTNSIYSNAKLSAVSATSKDGCILVEKPVALQEEIGRKERLLPEATTRSTVSSQAVVISSYDYGGPKPHPVTIAIASSIIDTSKVHMGVSTGGVLKPVRLWIHRYIVFIIVCCSFVLPGVNGFILSRSSTPKISLYPPKLSPLSAHSLRNEGTKLPCTSKR